MVDQDSGDIDFQGLNTSAKFVRVEANFDFREDPTFAESQQRWFFPMWQLKRPQMLLWVTGQPKGRMKLDPRLDDALSRGLKRLSRTTNMWILTSGLDSGVTSYIGETLGGFGSVPCIGISAVENVEGLGDSASDQVETELSMVSRAATRPKKNSRKRLLLDRRLKSDMQLSSGLSEASTMASSPSGKSASGKLVLTGRATNSLRNAGSGGSNGEQQQKSYGTQSLEEHRKCACLPCIPSLAFLIDFAPS